MPRLLQEFLQPFAVNDEGRRIDQRVKTERPDCPSVFINHQTDSVFMIEHQTKWRNRSGFNSKKLPQVIRRSEAQTPGFKHCPQSFCIYLFIVHHNCKNVVPLLFIAQQKLLCVRTGHFDIQLL